MLDKSSLYNVLAEGIYFWDKCSPLNFNFSGFPLLVLELSKFLEAHLRESKRELKGGGDFTPNR